MNTVYFSIYLCPLWFLSSVFYSFLYIGLLSLAFLYTNNEKTEREIKETISFTIATKRIKYLGVYLPKEKPISLQNLGPDLGSQSLLKCFCFLLIPLSPRFECLGLGQSIGWGWGSQWPEMGAGRGQVLFGVIEAKCWWHGGHHDFEPWWSWWFWTMVKMKARKGKANLSSGIWAGSWELSSCKHPLLCKRGQVTSRSSRIQFSD